MEPTLFDTAEQVEHLPTIDYRAWLATRPVIAVDTETSGVEWGATTRLVQFGDGSSAFSVGVETPAGQAIVREIFSTYDGTLIFHNAGFDIRALERVNVNPDYIWSRCVDTYTMSHILDPGGIHGLKPLCKLLFNEDDDAEQQALKKSMRQNKWTWGTIPVSELVAYGEQDAMLTYRLYERLLEKMESHLFPVLEREMLVSEIMYHVENHGLRLDRKYATELKTRWEADIAADITWFATQGIENPNSNRQVAAALKERGWVPGDTTPSGEAKLDKAVLKDLADTYEIAARLLAYKRKVKWLAAYVDNALEQADTNGYVHARYNTLGARTGRMSCSNPPLQQLPTGGGGEVRRLFLASPGNVIASVDYSAIELRLAGALSGETRIIDAYAAGEDIYQQVADSIGSTRTHAKVVVLASLYGAGGHTIAKNLGVSVTEATSLVENFWESYPTLSRWVISQTNKSKRTPPKSLWGRSLSPHAPYAAANAIIQGTAAEVLKDGLLRLSEAGLIHYVAAVVHDEVVIDVPEARAEELANQIAETLTDLRFDVPLVTDPEVFGASWGDGYAK